MGPYSLATPLARRAHEVDSVLGAVAAGHPARAVAEPEARNQPPPRLAQLGWLATKRTAWMLRRSTAVVPYLLAVAIREIYTRPHHIEQPRAAPAPAAPLAASSPGPRRAEGVVIDLAAHREHARLIRAAARLSVNVRHPG